MIINKLVNPKPDNLKENDYLVEDFSSEDDFQLVEEMIGMLILCPHCKRPLSQYWKKSKRKLKTRKDAQERYRCLRCGHSFTLYTLSFRMQHDEKTIKKFIELIRKGLTCWEIVDKNRLLISRMTSYRWFKKYIKELKKGDEK